MCQDKRGNVIFRKKKVEEEISSIVSYLVI